MNESFGVGPVIDVPRPGADPCWGCALPGQPHHDACAVWALEWELAAMRREGGL